MRLYFLVEALGEETRRLKAGGRFWKLESQDIGDSADGEELEFSCISYTWGEGRETSPLHLDFSVSDRTIPVLDTFIQHRPACERIWIDAFCVPHEPRARASSLESMGYIYSRAQEVVVVLSKAALPALENMISDDHVSEAHLSILEEEEWVSRAWTYQETVNARSLYITCEGASGTIVDGGHFLNCVGYTLSQMEGSSLKKRHRFPRLDTFQDVIVDYFIAGYEERSALSIMSNMDRRMQKEKADHFYAMIGAISTVRASYAGTIDACEAFMSVCERKGDYSFIYSGAQREETLGRRWRPVSGDLPSILRLQCWGSSQPGQADDNGLRLDKMIELCSGQLQDDAEQSIKKWLTGLEFPTADHPALLHQFSFQMLERMGFCGSPQCIDTAAGCFFPFEAVDPQKLVGVFVTTTIKWVFGGPGLACYEREAGHGTYYTPGVFIGIVDETAACSVRLG